MDADVIRRLKGLGLALWALVGVPSVFLAYINLSYGYALTHGYLPFVSGRVWLWFIVYGICLVSGAFCLARLPIVRDKNPLWAGVPYLLLMGVLLAGIHLAVACANGDCL